MNAVGDGVTIEIQDHAVFAKRAGVSCRGTFTENGVTKNFIQIVAVTESGALINFVGTAPQEAYSDLKDAMSAIAASVALKN
jgi:hypothetical protein